MGKRRGGKPDALHAELCSALSDLAKSVEVAVKRKALRDEIATTITDASEVANAAAKLRAAAYWTENSKSDHANVTSHASTMQGETQDSWARTTIVPDVGATKAEETWTRAALDSDVVTEHKPAKPVVASSVSQALKTQGEGPDTWARLTLVTDATANRVQDTWTRVEVDRDVVDGQPLGKQAVTTSILELYNLFGASTAKR